MIIITALLSAAYVLIWIGAWLGITRLIRLEKRLFPIVSDLVETLTPTLNFHHEIVAGIFFSISILPNIVKSVFNTLVIST